MGAYFDDAVVLCDGSSVYDDEFTNNACYKLTEPDGEWELFANLR